MCRRTREDRTGAGGNDTHLRHSASGRRRTPLHCERRGGGSGLPLWPQRTVDSSERHFSSGHVCPHPRPFALRRPNRGLIASRRPNRLAPIVGPSVPCPPGSMSVVTTQRSRLVDSSEVPGSHGLLSPLCHCNTRPRGGTSEPPDTRHSGPSLSRGTSDRRTVPSSVLVLWMNFRFELPGTVVQGDSRLPRTT